MYSAIAIIYKLIIMNDCWTNSHQSHQKGSRKWQKIHNWLVDRPGEVSSEKNCCSNWCFWIKWKHVFKGQLLYCFKSCVIQLISCCKKLICRLNCSEIREWETWFQICWRLHDYSSSIFNNYSMSARWIWDGK